MNPLRQPTIRFALAGLLLLSIVAISLIYASTETGSCEPGGDLLAFERRQPPAPVPEVTFLDEAGAERTLAAFHGRGLVVNFWATWCAPCVREMPALDRLRATLAPDGIDVLALSEDRGGAPVVREFYRVNGIEHLPISLDKGARAVRAFSVRGLPTTVLIDADGNEVGRLTGAAEWDTDAAAAFVRACIGG